MIKNVVEIMCIICILFIFGCDCNAMPADLIDTPYADAAETLSALKIIQYNKDNLFLPDEIITRAEFTVAIAHMLGIADVKENIKTDTPFSDVDASYWASGEINFMVNYKKGIIKGFEDGRFIPEASITYDQAVKILVCALGYDNYAEQKGGYPLGYLAVAKDIGIINNADKAVGFATRRGEAALLLYNCLDVDVMEQTRFGKDAKYTITKGENVLKKYFKVNKIKGVLKATHETTLIGESSLSEDEVEIENIIYKIGDTNAAIYFGYDVTAYAKEDVGQDKDLLLFVKPERKNHVITLNADEIMDTTIISKIEYIDDEEESGKRHELSISPVANLIYNGKAYPNYDKSDFTPNSGKVVLLDREDDGEYDVIFVTEYKTFAVDYVLANAQVIYGKEVNTGNQWHIDINSDNNDNIITIKKDGKEINLDKINKWDILSIEESKNNGKKLIIINVISEKIKGIVQEKVVGDDYIVIEGKKYFVKSSIIDKIEVGDEGTYCLDAEGKIAAVDYKKLFSEEEYGYLTKIEPTKGVDANLQFEILTTDGDLVVFIGADKIKLSGYSSLLEKSKVMLNLLPKQLIRFKTNSNGEINEINTAEDLANADNATKTLAIEKNKFRKSSVIKDQKYRKNNSSFNSKVFIDNLTFVFVIPEVPDDPNQSTDKDKYSVLTSSYFVYDAAYSLESYDESEFNLAKVVLIKAKPTVSSGSYNNTPLFLVDKVVSSINEEGEVANKIYGYLGKQYISYYSTKDCDIEMVNSGDVIQVYVNPKGKVEDFTRIFKISDGDKLIDNPDDLHVEAEFIIGKITNISQSEKKMKIEDLNSNISFDLSYSSLTVSIYDEKKREKKCMAGTISDLEIGDFIVLHVRYSTVQEIVGIRFN